MAPPKGHLPYPGCEKGGRPIEYTNEIIEGYADELDEWIEDEQNFWLNKFFTERYIDPDLGSIWSKNNNKFSGSYKRAKKIQENRIYTNALKNKFNAKMACFGLMNNHGWSEKTESKLSGDAENPLAILFNHSKGLVNDSKEE